MDALLVYITAPDAACARNLAKSLVGERLCACANIVDGMESVYWWNNVLENGTESIVICKTTQAAYPFLEKRVKELHPFETPCVVALPLARGHTPFLQWISDETHTPVADRE